MGDRHAQHVSPHRWRRVRGGCVRGSLLPVADSAGAADSADGGVAAGVAKGGRFPRVEQGGDHTATSNDSPHRAQRKDLFHFSISGGRTSRLYRLRVKAIGADTSKITNQMIRQFPGMPNVENRPKPDTTAMTKGLATSFFGGGAVWSASKVVDTLEVLAVP